mmetsp:Transcript_97639/g.209498  ORF Transcript_97639/g.209498 Transcript_97639/m.209498 type:complete len:557 (-) Transcript_97639:87-1757(-)
MAAGAAKGNSDYANLDSIAVSLTDQAASVLGPPESVEPSSIYKLYRGAAGEVQNQNYRVWVEFPALQLCWAGYDRPARAYDRASLLDLSLCACRTITKADFLSFRVEIFGETTTPTQTGTRAPDEGAADQGRRAGATGAAAIADDRRPVLSVSGQSETLREFAEALQKLLVSRESEGRRGLEFIQKRLFQYLWRHQGTCFSEEALYEAQAVLAFNLDPKEGVAYLRGKLGKITDLEVGEWLAQMSTQKGGLDPTMLGAYFSRRDSLEVFKSFVRCLDFSSSDIVAALRLLFDTFKPGGEGQVITRILEMFAEAYFLQWARKKDLGRPKLAYANSDSVLQVAVSLIMLNTGLHVATKKVGKRAAGVAMSVEEYIDNTRRVVGPEEVPEEALRLYYEAVKQVEISVEPLPRVAFSKLPVQPDIEGWLIAILSSKLQRRYWAVMALQRMYLFSDASEVEPVDAIDLKDVRVRSVADDRSCRDRFVADLQVNGGCSSCFSRQGRHEFLDADTRAFEVSQVAAGEPVMLKKLSKPRARLAFLAESPDLTEKWVHLISSGPY